MSTRPRRASPGAISPRSPCCSNAYARPRPRRLPIVVTRPSGFPTRSKQLVVEEELRRYGVSIRYCTLRVGDNAEDRLLKNVRASIAEYEREKTVLRSTRGRREKAERGLVVGAGPAPYGYRYLTNAKGRADRLEPDPLTSPVVARIFAWLRTESAGQVALRLNAEGVPAP